MIPIPDSFSDVDSYLQFGGDDLDGKIKLFLDTLTSAAREIGLTVKPDETCVSRDIVIYGKDILKKESFMPQALKRISRTLADVNEIYPTMETKIATVQTSGSASSQKSLNYVAPYVVSTTETLMVVMREFYYLRRKALVTQEDYQLLSSREFKDFLLHLSSEMGGCPILNPLHFLYRGHPDHFTAYTTFLQKISKYSHIAARILNYLKCMRVEVGRADPELLISNPCAVNIRSPQTISNQIRQDLEDILIQITKNRDLSHF
jgi:hypothetical protein